MNLDFSKLEKIGNSGQDRKANEKRGSNLSPQQVKGGKQYENTNNNKNPLKSDFEPNKGINLLQRKIDKRKAEIEGNQRIFSEYQENIRASSKYKIEVLKGLRSGEDINILLLRACKAISCMTGDIAFYDQVEGDMNAYYMPGIKEELLKRNYN